jgi:DNA-binding transcriptional MocR family regulator
VAVTAGGPYFTAEAPAPHLRLSYVSTPGTAQLEEGIHRLRQALPQSSALPAEQKPTGA